MTEDEQTKGVFSTPNRKDAYLKARAETPEQKGLSYTDLLVDNIIGLDNEYESFGEAFGKSFNEDELGTLKNMAVSAYEGAKEFVTSPIETTKDVATEISDSVSRLGAESLDGRIKRMYGVGYQDATEEQVTKAREAVIGDAITASSLVPAAKGVTTVAKAAIPGKVQADVVGQMRSLIDGDREFRTESKNPPVGLSAEATGAAYKSRMFSSGEVGLTPSNYSVAEFYSPTVETIRNTEFPSKGYKGSELLKLLQDKTPGVRKAELSAMNLGIDPQKRYNKDEVLGLAEKRSYKVTAEVVDNDENRSSQRQDIRDQEVDYATIKINATPSSEEVDSFLPTRGYTHYDPETIAHTRLSIRQNQAGEEYLLIEELQSDLLQHGSTKPRGPVSVDGAYEEVLGYLREDVLKDPAVSSIYNYNPKYFDNYFKISAENSRQYIMREKGIKVPKEDVKKLDALVEETRAMRDELVEVVKENKSERFWGYLNGFFEKAGYDEGYRVDRRTKAVGPSPISEDSDAVRLTLQTAMAKANDSGVSSLVIPNIQRIIAADRARPGSNAYEKYMQPGSGFQRTYVKGVEKFIKQLQSEYGDAIKIETVELPYVKEKLYHQGQEMNVPSTAIKIDFSGLKGVDLRVGRFAEGGMVEDQQMNKLMQEGGIADDGMSVEPVTGNEIPPGSMASEVRDDIDAKLSEGEYVVPADVVRFFGVRFFEDLRNQAKQGLQEMDADGRIGGAPVDAQGVPVEGAEEELTPEEEQMLMEALGGAGGNPVGMAYGGMVQQPAPTPYQDQATMYQMPEGMGGPMGMQEGGLTRDGTSTFDRTQFTIPESSGAFESRKYINPTTGEEKTVQFLNGVPMGLVPEGFVPWTPALSEQAGKGTQTPTTQTPKVESVKVERGGRDMDTGPTTGSTGEGSLSYDRWAEKNADAITSDPYGFGVNALSDKSGTTVGKGLGVAGALMGGPVGAVIGGLGLGARATSEVQNIAEARAALGVMEAKGLKGTAQYNDLEARIESKIDDLPAGQRIAVRTGVVATGTGYASAALGATSKPEAATTGSTATPSKDKDKGISVGYGKGQVDPGLAAAAGLGGGNKQQGSATGGAKSSGGGGGADSGQAASGNKSSGATPGGNTGTGGPGNVGGSKSGGSAGASSRSGGAFAPGGLVTKKASATKKAKKGLAS